MNCSWPVSSAKLSRNLFLESGTFLWRPGLVLFLVLQCLHCSSFRTLRAVSQHLWAAMERPVVKACPLLCPSPVFLWQGCSSLCFVSLRRYWDQEVLRAQKDAREPSLMKAIVKCYGKSYLVWGMLTFLEVKAFPYSALRFSVRGSVLRWMDWGGERTVV